MYSKFAETSDLSPRSYENVPFSICIYIHTSMYVQYTVQSSEKKTSVPRKRISKEKKKKKDIVFMRGRKRRRRCLKLFCSLSLICLTLPTNECISKKNSERVFALRVLIRIFVLLLFLDGLREPL